MCYKHKMLREDGESGCPILDKSSEGGLTVEMTFELRLKG